MLTPINEERGKLTAQCRRRVVDREDRIGQPHIPVVLASVGKCAQGISQHPVDPFRLSVGVLVVGRAHQKT